MVATKIYSSRIWSVSGAGAGESDFLLDSSALVYVIRDIDFQAPILSHGFLAGFYVSILDVGPLWAMPPGSTRSSQSYHWRGRSVAYPGETLVVQTLDVSWSWSISGYAFPS